MNEDNKIIIPFHGVAKQSIGCQKDGMAVGHICHKVEDERLWGLDIPIGVDAESYLREYSLMLDRLEQAEKVNLSPALVRSENRNIIPDKTLANFSVKPILKICYIDRYGRNINDMEKIIIEVQIAGGVAEAFEIFTKEIVDITKLIKKRYSAAIVSFAEANAERIIEAEFRNKTQFIPTRKRLFEYGWQMIEGRYRYVNDSMAIGSEFEVKTGMSLPYYTNYTTTDVRDVFLRALRLYEEKSTMYSMLLFSLLGVLYRLFEEAGFAPHFLLFVNGKSGSMKTELSKILFIQLTDEKYRNNPRRLDADTITSFERAIVLKGHDTTLLFDDYAPAKTVQKKAELQNKLETLVRMVGDGATKSRSNASLQDIQGEGVRGVIAVTGELKGKGFSSNLRCLYCEMSKKQVNTDNITWFQNDRRAYTTAIMYFTDYISFHWKKIVSEITQKFNVERKRISKRIHEKRLVDSATVLCIVADVFEEFLISFCDMDRLIVQNIIMEMRESVVQNAYRNELLIQEEAYGEIFIKGMNALMVVNKITLCKNKMLSEHVDVYDGFEDDKYFYFLPEVTYAKTINFLGQTRQFIPFDLRDLVISMHEDGIIKTYSNGDGKKTYFARINVGNERKQKFLKISKSIFYAVVDGNYNNDCSEEGI